jgi:Spy/CpxP family protein refolding chaperone
MKSIKAIRQASRQEFDAILTPEQKAKRKSHRRGYGHRNTST